MKEYLKIVIKLKQVIILFFLILAISSSFNDLFSRNNLIVKEPVLQPFQKDSSSKMNLPSAYEKILDEALDFQFKADSLNTLAGEQKNILEKLLNAEKSAFKIKISENELLAFSLQMSADQKYDEAMAAMVLQNEKSQQKTAIQKSDNKGIKDSVQQTFTIFEVLTKPVIAPNEKITIDPEVPDGLIYRIQIAIFRNPVAPAYFKGIIPVYGFRVAGTDKINYYAGMFRRSSDASKALAAVKVKGFRDAFVVALSGNKPVSADRAAILEKEWGRKPFVNISKSVLETPIDTVPPTLSFRVEVVRSIKPLKDDIVEGILKMAGNRGLDIKPLDDGNIAYLIGKFITFESAAEYTDLLIRNGYRETRVVAWLGKKEIPVETARQLFENLK